MPQFWLIKAEGESHIKGTQDIRCNIDDVKEANVVKWDGIRNYEARNNLLLMKMGDKVIFYHSNTKQQPPAVVGLVEVARTAYPDEAAFDPNNYYYDPKRAMNAKEKFWMNIDVQFKEKFKEIITLHQIKQMPELKDMVLVRKPRLSVQTVTKKEYEFILSIAKRGNDKNQ